MANVSEQLHVLPEGATPLPFSSFQAEFFDLHSDKPIPLLAKIYGKERVWGMIPLDIPAERTRIIKSEIASLNSLAPQMHASYGEVQMPNGTTEQAVIMRKLQPTEFLENKLASGETIPLEKYKELAHLVARFHFNPEMELPTVYTPMNEFLTDLMGKEMEILTNNFPNETPTYEKWDSLMRRYISAYEPLLTRRKELLGEPVIGHGDTKISNIIITDDGIGVTDPAPIDLWKLNDRRMDAYFLVADLELAGLKEEARVYWETYCQDYAEHTQKLGLTPQELEEVADSTKVIDLISYAYRYGIFYRLAKASGNEHRAALAKQYLDVVYEEIATVLSE